MENRLENSRAALAALVVVALVVAVASIVSSPPALASHVEPVFVEGNPSCSDFTDGGTEFKIPEDVDGIQLVDGELAPVSSGTYGDGVIEVTLTVKDTEDGMEFDWSTNFGVDEIIVKGGDNANRYSYPMETSDTGLHAPLNPNSGDWFGLSHISFCYFPENATTPPPEDTTTTITTDPTTTTTAQATTTTTEQATTTTTTSTQETTATTTAQEPTTTTTIGAEVLGTTITTTPAEVSPSTLPFTGVESEHLAMLAMVFVGGGLLLLVGASSTRRAGKE